MKQEFALDDKNLLIKEQYEQNDNYCVEEIGNGDKCFIFFSSNGLWVPNEQAAFEEQIIKKDRYEWKKVGHSKEILSQAGRIIYVRDIYKQFYVCGINKNINTINSLCELLRKLTRGMKVITCGISSGGYMATITGIFLQAEIIFNFGGQWSLSDIDRNMYFTVLHANEEKYRRYYNITWLLKNNKIPVLYFYSAFNQWDIQQIGILRSYQERENIYCYAMNSDLHGYCLFKSCYKKLLTGNFPKMLKINQKYGDGKKIISLRKMCFHLLGFREACCEIVKDMAGKQEI